MICNFDILLKAFGTFLRFCKRFVFVVFYFPFNNFPAFHAKAALVDSILSQGWICSVRFPCGVILMLLRARPFAVTFLATHNAKNIVNIYIAYRTDKKNEQLS